MKNKINHYKGGKIVQDEINYEVENTLKRIKEGYYKILNENETITMKNGQFHIIGGKGYTLSALGLKYFQLIYKKMHITYYIKTLFEHEKWDELLHYASHIEK